MGFTREDKENRKFEEDPSDSSKVVVKTKVENESSDPVPVEIVNADGAVDIQVEIPGTITLDDSTPIDVNITDASIDTNATIQGTPDVSVTNTPSVTVSGTPSVNSTIQNASIPVTAAETLNVSVQNAFQYIYSMLYDGSTWRNQSSDAEGRAINKQQLYYSTDDITALSSSTSVVTWINAFVDGVLLKEYTSSFSGSSKVETYFTHPNISDGGKCLRVVNTFHSGGGVETSFPTVQDWNYDSFATPAAAVALGTITHPALDAAAGTDVCTITPSGGPAGCTYVLTLTGTDASLYQINNTTTGTTPGASVAASLGDTIVLETASTFAYTTTGYSHGPMTITNTEQTNSQAVSTTASTARVVPATLTLGTVTSPANDAAAGTDVCSITPGGGPGGSTYVISLSGTNASLYQINNTTTGTTPGSSVAASLGDTIVLETVALFEYEATGYSHSLTVTNTEQTNSETASGAVATTQEADTPAFSNETFLDFDAASSDQHFSMGNQSKWDDSDSFFFRRRSDAYTISWWMKFPSTSADYTSGGYSYDSHIFTSADPGNTGVSMQFRGDSFWFVYNRDSSISAVWDTGDVTGWQDGNWHHFVVTYDGPAAVAAADLTGREAAAVLYVDGSVEAWTLTEWGGAAGWLNSDVYDTDNTDSHVRFGHPTHPLFSRTNEICSVDEIAIWKTDLSSAQVTTLYNSGTPFHVVNNGLESANLKRYYSFEELAGWHFEIEESSANTRYIEMGLKSDFDNAGDGFFFRRRSDKYSISWWMRHTSLNTSSYFSQMDFIWVLMSDYDYGTMLSERTSQFYLYFRSASGNYGIWQYDSDTWNDGDWHHYVFTWDGPGAVTAGAASSEPYAKMYRDGSLLTADTFQQGGTWLDTDIEDGITTEEFRFGRPDFNYSEWSNKIADYKEIAIWKTDLSAANVTTLYNSGVPYGDDTTDVEGANIKRYYKGDTTDGTGNYTAVPGSSAKKIAKDIKLKYDGKIGQDPDLGSY